MAVVMRLYFTITPGKYEQATKIMERLMSAAAKHGLPQGRVLAGHFVSPGQPNWQWEADFSDVYAAQKALDKYDEMAEMATIGPSTYGVWNQQGMEIFHVVEGLAPSSKKPRPRPQARGSRGSK